MRQFTGKVLAAGLAGGLVFGGAVLAVAEEGTAGDDVPVDDTTTTTAVDEVVDPTTSTTVPDEEPEAGDAADAGDAGDLDAPEDGAREHPENHGRYVSEAAHDGEPGPGHGAAVSGVARSGAGMPAAANKGGAATKERGGPGNETD